MTLSNNAKQLLRQQFAHGGAHEEIIGKLEGTIDGLTATGEQLNAAAALAASITVTAEQLNFAGANASAGTATAGTTQTLAGATQIVKGYTAVTVGNNNDGVKLSDSIIQQTILNTHGSYNLLVYPPTAEAKVDYATAAGNPATVLPNTFTVFLQFPPVVEHE